MSAYANPEKIVHQPHIPVLLQEVTDAFKPVVLEGFIDGTVGAGGHAAAILQQHPELHYYLGLDQDPQALALAQERLAPWASKVLLKQGNFAQLQEHWRALALPPPNGILADLGVSSMQLDRPERGFSFMQPGPLDMRMDPALSLTAADILNSYTEKALGQLFRDYGEEPQWRRAAQAIVAARQKRLFRSIDDIKAVLLPLLARRAKKGIHPLTLVFQGLRIAVNGELDALEAFLPQALTLLPAGGRLAVISFHSLEDRLVKTHLRLASSDKWDTSGIGGLFLDKQPSIQLVHKKVITANLAEVAQNPRSRSAKLRVAEKIGPSWD